MKIGIIGTGTIGGGIAQQLAGKHEVYGFDHHTERLEELTRYAGVHACNSVEEVVKASEWIFICIKPQDLDKSAEEIYQFLDRKRHLIVSVLAGIKLETLRAHFGKVPVLRIIPNLPMVFGQGVIGIAKEEGVDKENVDSVLSPLGALHWVPEEKMDAVSALAGSGPGFFFAIYEAMVDSGIALGFTSEVSQQLVQEMIKGSLTMLEKTGEHPSQLRWKVTSPGGTTIAGLKAMEDAGVRAGIMNTFLACYKRNQELG